MPQNMENQTSINEEFILRIHSLPVLNLNTFDNLKKQTQSQPDLLKEIFDSFFEDVTEMMAGLRQSVESKDFENYTATLHTLKGLSGTIGATRLFEITNYLYTQARMNDFSSAVSGLPLIHQSILELKDELDGKI